MSKVTLKYWFVYGESIGNIYENEKGNWVIAFDGIMRIGERLLVRDRNGNNVDPDELGLMDILKDFLTAKP